MEVVVSVGSEDQLLGPSDVELDGSTERLLLHGRTLSHVNRILPWLRVPPKQETPNKTVAFQQRRALLSVVVPSRMDSPLFRVDLADKVFSLSRRNLGPGLLILP